ncbi:putative damage-inducible protein DinB [Streptomonospora nanhaiensis]|uniref:Putative damage-inducible protein DinB n=1 Tax=Streptomonospora nanhaiensis TaxID=1323731 RepID=A0A853BK26_9ACTN|nr:DinB family protein [Streptomonospora nanhaiensis]NYI95858.1 putative damage-inducible protein DinB [Streptomonospora nanhaiensis]
MTDATPGPTAPAAFSASTDPARPVGDTAPLPGPLTVDQVAPWVLGTTTADERATLTGFLDYLRWAAARKARGLTDSDSRRRLVPSDTTVAGVLRHLTLVERNWFQRVLRADPAVEDELRPLLAAVESTFTVPDHTPIAAVIADYERECARSRAAVADHALDHAADHDELGPVSLRWILVHMIEETARHAGHLDILREQTDGTTGDRDPA